MGSESWKEFEGALNVPLIADRLAVRLSGNIVRRDGYTRNMNFPGKDFNNRHGQSFRVSVLADPVDGVKNLLVVERYTARTNGGPPVLYSYDAANPGLPNAVPFFNDTFYTADFTTAPPTVVPCLGRPVCSISAAFERQKAAGPRAAWTPFLMPDVTRSTTATNTTTIDIGSAQLKNIFGYLSTYSNSYVNQGGIDGHLIVGHRITGYEQFTEELQLSGKLFNDTVGYIIGAFYLDYSPKGTRNYEVVGTGLQLTQNVDAYGAGGLSSYYHDKSKSLYGQLNIEIPGVEGLSVDAGGRYTKDNHKACTASDQVLATLATEEQCRANVGLAAGSGTISSADSNWNYTFGANYQMTPSVLAYATTRRSYRAGGLNAPVLGGTLAGYKSYRPERVTDYELGLKTRFDIGTVRGSLNVAAFQANYTDLQYGLGTSGVNVVLGPPPGGSDKGGADGDFISTDDPTVLLYANVGDGRVRGVEADATIDLTQNLRLSGGVSVLDKKITDNTFVAPANWTLNLPAQLLPGTSLFESGIFTGSPDFSYNVAINFRAPLASEYGELMLRAKISGSGKVRYETITVPSYSLLNLRADWNGMLGSKLDGSLFVTNATDKAVVAGPGIAATGFAFNTAYYNEPRMIGLQLRYHFGN